MSRAYDLARIVGHERAMRCVAIVSERAHSLDSAIAACAAVCAEDLTLGLLEQLAAALAVERLIAERSAKAAAKRRVA